AGVGVAADDGVGFHPAVAGAVLVVGDALAAVGVQEVEAAGAGAAGGGIGSDGDGDQAEAEQTRPGGAKAGRGPGRRGIGFGGCARQGQVVGKAWHRRFSLASRTVGLRTTTSVGYLRCGSKSSGL